MPTLPAASLKLTQTKLFTGSRFAAQHLAFLGVPTKLANAFVIEVATGTDLERLVRVATLADIDNGSIPVNPLNRFTRGSTFAGTALAGDTLRISSPPGEWDPTLPGFLDFTVTGLDAGRLMFATPFWYRKTDLTWTLLRDVSTIASGSTGAVERQNTGAAIWKADRWVGVFNLPSDALAHVRALAFDVKTLVDQAAISPQEYLDYTPGNPINNTFEG